MKDPLDLRLLCGVLEGLADDGISCLDVYSKDILMVEFPDAVELGQSLESMEMEVIKEIYLDVGTFTLTPKTSFWLVKDTIWLYSSYKKNMF
jgi:hypothetical protein